MIMKKILVLAAFCLFSLAAMADGIDRKSIKEMTVEEKTLRAQALEKSFWKSTARRSNPLTATSAKLFAKKPAKSGKK